MANRLSSSASIQRQEGQLAVRSRERRIDFQRPPHQSLRALRLDQEAIGDVEIEQDTQILRLLYQLSLAPFIIIVIHARPPELPDGGIGGTWVIRIQRESMPIRKRRVPRPTGRRESHTSSNMRLHHEIGRA